MEKKENFRLNLNEGEENHDEEDIRRDADKDELENLDENIGGSTIEETGETDPSGGFDQEAEQWAEQVEKRLHDVEGRITLIFNDIDTIRKTTQRIDNKLDDKKQVDNRRKGLRVQAIRNIQTSSTGLWNDIRKYREGREMFEERLGLTRTLEIADEIINKALATMQELEAHTRIFQVELQEAAIEEEEEREDET